MSLVAVLVLALVPLPQEAHASRDPQLLALNLGHRSAARRGGDVEVVGLRARATLREWVAETELVFDLANRSARPQPIEFLVPLPNGAAVKEIAYTGDAAEPRSEVLPAAAAKLTYDDLVRRAIDPALLEFVGWDCVRTSVFPVPPGTNFQVRIKYEHTLETTATGAMRYVLPRSTLLDRNVPFKLELLACSWHWLAGMDAFSPTHAITQAPGSLSSIPSRVIALDPAAGVQPGSFELFLKPTADQGGASLFTAPDGEGGHFALLRFVPPPVPAGRSPLERDVVLVLDRSGSMRGEKFEQARAGAIAILAGLRDGERFNIVDYSDTVQMLWAQPELVDASSRAVARNYLLGLEVGGGTNFYEALRSALAQLQSAQHVFEAKGHMPPPRVPIVLALTDGLPTVGITDEAQIRDLVSGLSFFVGAAPSVHTLGVGDDVNAPLLDSIASRSGAASHYVRPGEDTERALTEVFADLDGPVLTQVQLVVEGAEMHTSGSRLFDVYPAKLPELFAGDALTIAGRVRGEGALFVKVTGRAASGPVECKFTFGPEAFEQAFDFVPRLWATRRIAFLSEQVRAAGGVAPDDGRLAELSDEILRLSMRYGVLSEYSSFLVHEGTDLSDWSALVACNGENIKANGIDRRSGVGQVAQGMNWNARSASTCQNLSNDMIALDGSRVSFGAVQALGDRAYVLRPVGEEAAPRWIDGRLIEAGLPEPARTVSRGGADYAELVGALALEGRAACVALEGEVLVAVGGEVVLVR